MNVTKQQLELATSTAKANTREVLQIVYDSIESPGQKKKLLKNEVVKELFDRFNVDTE